MTKIRLLSISVGALLLLNLGIIAILLTRGGGEPTREAHFSPPGPGGRHHPGPRHIVINRLGFDESQIQAYAVLIDAHMEQVKEKEQALGAIKEELYKTLGTAGKKDLADQWEKLSEQVVKIEQLHYQHFAEIRALCRKNQLPAFQELIKDLAQIFRRGGRPAPPPRRRP